MGCSKLVLLTALAASACSLVVGLVGPGAAWAQNYDRQGAYIGVGFSWAFQNLGLPESELLKADDSPGFDIRAGYRFHPNFAIEGDLLYFTGFDFKAQDPSDTKVGSMDTLAMTVNAKGYGLYGLTGRVQPYGLVGLGFMRASFDPNEKGVDSEDDTTFALRLGAGVDCYATENIVVYAEASYLLPTSDYKFREDSPEIGGGIIPLAVGMQYRF